MIDRNEMLTIYLNVINPNNPEDKSIASVNIILNSPPEIYYVGLKDSDNYREIKVNSTNEIEVLVNEKDKGSTINYTYSIFEGDGSLEENSNTTGTVTYIAPDHPCIFTLLTHVKDERNGENFKISYFNIVE